MAIELGKFNVKDLKENEYKILGIGINKRSNLNGLFPVNYTTLEQTKDNLVNLISTRKGERMMQPEFGCDIWRLIFEPIVRDQLDFQIESTILEAVRIWLPYVNIDYVIFDYDDNDIDNNRIELQVQFSLKSNPTFGDTVTILIES